MLSVMFCIGAFIWPPLGGALMDQLGERAMPVSLVVAYSLFLPIVLVTWLRGPFIEGASVKSCPMLHQATPAPASGGPQSGKGEVARADKPPPPSSRTMRT